MAKCRPCHRRTAEKWRRANPAKVKAYHRRANLKRLYGITVEEFDEILKTQGGGCGICGQFYPEPRMMHVDHDHSTGRVRGILCLHCNTGIGQLRHDVQLLQSAIEYCRACPEAGVVTGRKP